MNLIRNYPKLNGTYGLNISYCPSDKSVGTEYLAMEHAPMAIMMENYRTGLIWKPTGRNQNDSRIYPGILSGNSQHRNPRV